MHSDQVAARAAGDARRPADQPVAAGRTGECDHDPLTRFPGVGDAVVCQVVLEAVLHPVGHPQQCQLTQRSQVPRAEVVRQRGIDLLRRVHVAVGHAPPQRFRRHVDQLDLIGSAHEGIGHGLPLGDAGDSLDDVVERLEVLHVDGGHHVDPRGEQLLHVLPALRVPHAGGVGVRQFVDERDCGTTGEHRVEVHLGERGLAMSDVHPRYDLEIADLLARLCSFVVLDEADDHVGATLRAASALVEHGVRLAHARRCSEVDAQCSPCHAPSLPGVRDLGVKTA